MESEGFLLDTNIFRELMVGNQVVLRHWEGTALPIYLSSVVVEEVLAGFMANLNRARSGKFPVLVPQAHADLISALDALKHFTVLTYSPAAEALFVALPADVKRRGS